MRSNTDGAHKAQRTAKYRRGDKSLMNEPNIYATFLFRKIIVSFPRAQYHTNGKQNEACSRPQRLGTAVRGNPELHYIFNIALNYIILNIKPIQE